MNPKFKKLNPKFKIRDKVLFYHPDEITGIGIIRDIDTSRGWIKYSVTWEHHGYADSPHSQGELILAKDPNDIMKEIL